MPKQPIQEIKKIGIGNWQGKTYIGTNGGSELETLVWKINELIDAVNELRKK